MDVLMAGSATGGTISGAGKFLREKVRIVMALWKPQRCMLITHNKYHTIQIRIY